MSQDLIHRLANLVGADGAEAILAEFGGTTIHIPRLNAYAMGEIEIERIRIDLKVAALRAQYGGASDTYAYAPGAGWTAQESLRRDGIRRLCLHLLGGLRPTRTTKDALLTCVLQFYPDATRMELLRHLDYLRICDLIAIHADGVRLTKAGIDHVEGGAA